MPQQPRPIRKEKETVDFDMFRFSARAGQEWVIEVDASRSGSPVDSFVEVLTSDGQRIERWFFRRSGTHTSRSGEGRQHVERLQYLQLAGDASQ
ncbi:MAG: hypothetical protein R3B91_10665 [Planctomycetaceae bacterium]